MGSGSLGGKLSDLIAEVDFKVTGFELPGVLGSDEGEVGDGDFEGEAFEAAEEFRGWGDGGVGVADVELNDFGAFAFAGIGEVDGDEECLEFADAEGGVDGLGARRFRSAGLAGHCAESELGHLADVLLDGHFGEEPGDHFAGVFGGCRFVLGEGEKGGEEEK